MSDLKNVPMNRAMRRLLARGKGLQQETVVPLPAMIDEWNIFDIPERILHKLRNGEIEAVRGVPVFQDNTGELCEVCPALSGWIFTWNHINEKLGLNLNMTPLGKLHNKLNAAMMLTEQDVCAAQAALDSIRAIFRASDRQRIKQLAQDAQIAILTVDAQTLARKSA